MMSPQNVQNIKALYAKLAILIALLLSLNSSHDTRAQNHPLQKLTISTATTSSTTIVRPDHQPLLELLLAQVLILQQKIIAPASESGGGEASSNVPPPPVPGAGDERGSGGTGATRPTVSITAPAESSTVTGTVTVVATATSSTGIAGVQFKLDGVNLGAEDAAAPYTAVWDTASSTNGMHVISAAARDTAGNLATIAVVVTVSETVSLANLSAVPSHTSVGIKLTWEASSKSAVNVERWADGSTPETITTITGTSEFLDTSVQANRFYNYRVSSGTVHTNTMTAVLSDTSQPFVCPAIPLVPANLLGVDRTESFESPNGKVISFTIRAPIRILTQVDVPPCGTKAGCSDYDDIKNAIATVITAGGGTVQLAAGDYHLYHPVYANIAITNAKDLILAGAGQSGGIPLTHLYLNNVSTSTVAVGIQVSSSERVLVKDVSIDWDVVNAIPGIVHDAGSNEQRFDVQDPSYYIPAPANPPNAFNVTGYNLETRTYTQATGARLGVSGPFNSNFANDHRYYYLLKGSHHFPDGATAIAYVKTGAALRAASSSDISFEGVHVYGGGGPGIIFGPDGRGLRLSNFKITRKPDSLLKPGEKPRLVALFGDSDANGSRGGILIENSEFGFIDDDTFYNRGFAGQLSAVHSTSEVEITNRWSPVPHTRTSNDVLMFSDPQTLAPISNIWPTAGEWTLKKTQDASGADVWKWTVPFSPAIPELAYYQGLPPGRLPIVSEPRYAGPDFIIRNTCSHDNHGRIFAQAVNGLIENNVFGNSYYGPIELNTFPTLLSDGPGPGNIIVRNNKIIGCGYGSTDRDWLGKSNGKRQTGWARAAILVSAISSTGFVPEQGYPNRSLQIMDNFISNTPGLAISILGARDVKVRGNTIVDANAIPFEPDFDKDYCGLKSQGYQKSGANQPWCLAKLATKGAIMVAHSMNVELSANTFLGTSEGVFVDPGSTIGITQQ
jgi:Bacterial Ig domain